MKTLFSMAVLLFIILGILLGAVFVLKLITEIGILAFFGYAAVLGICFGAFFGIFVRNPR